MRIHECSIPCYIGEIAQAEKNLLAGNFHADAPDQVLVTDVSMFPTKRGKVYLSPLIECFYGKVLEYRMEVVLTSR